MGHHHHHSTNENLKLAFILNASFAILEIIGGFWINSVAILSDALHDLGDSFSLGLAWFLNRYAEKEHDDKFSYGYRRFSLLGALLNAIILIVGSLYILSEAIPRLLSPEPFNARGMVLFALLGIAVNGWAVLRLKDEESQNAQVVSWHLLEDVLGWITVLAVGLISLVVNVPILDPILSIFLAGFILYNVFKKLRETVDLFLQSVPKNIDIVEIEAQLQKIDCVDSLHHTHIWSLDGENNVFTTHLVVGENISRDKALNIKQNCKDILNDLHLHLTHITIEIEYTAADCSMCETPLVTAT